MASGDGPPARNTCLAAHTARNEDLRAPPSEGVQSSAPARSERLASRKGSALTSIAESASDKQRQSEEDNAPSEHETIRKLSEEVPDQEQSYTTAPGSFGPSTDPAGLRATTSSEAQVSKRRRRPTVTPTHSDKGASPWGQRGAPPHLTRVDEKMGQLRDSLSYWAAIAEESRAEVSNLQDRVTRSFNQTTDVAEAMQGMQRMVDRMIAWDGGQLAPSNSPRAMASWALFAECGSNEGTVDYECRQGAQARFGAPQIPDQARIETEGHNSASPTRADIERSSSSSHTRSKERIAPSQLYAIHMAESRACAAWRRPQGQTHGPLPQVRARGGGDPDNEPSGSSGDKGNGNRPQSRADTGSLGSNQHGGPLLGNANAFANTGSAQNALEQDYAHQSTSTCPQQIAGPMMIPGPTQGQSLVPQAPSLPTQGQAKSDHELYMIENLRNHIRESLTGIPDNLPELKGPRAKVPDAYAGEDDFDKLYIWLQGLIRFLKIHHLTGTDKDRDKVLVTGTCLKGKAERWFTQEVERPS